MNQNISKTCIKEIFKFCITKKHVLISAAILLITITIILIIVFTKKSKDTFQNEKQVVTTSSVIPSYWYKYSKSDTRSKCFDCDASSKYHHGVPCFDCEIPGGRQINPELNRVLTR